MTTSQPQPENGTPGHTIGAVAQLTGLSVHVLRAWERRYDVVRPTRTPGRHRLYTDGDVRRLRLLRRATESGWPIGQVAGLSTPDLLDLIGRVAEAAGAGGRDGDGEGEAKRASSVVVECVEAAARLDDAALSAHLTRAVVRLGPREFVERVAGPLLHEAGALWHSGAWLPAQEHVVSVTVRRTLEWLLSIIEVASEAPLVVATTASGERHELGAMLAAVSAADHGWRVLYLGPDLPAGDIAAAAAARGADAVTLSAVYVEDIAGTGSEIERLRSALPEGVELLVGGRAVANGLRERVRRAGATPVEDFDVLRVMLDAIRDRPAGGADE